jgi:hypothetical protein
VHEPIGQQVEAQREGDKEKGRREHRPRLEQQALNPLRTICVPMPASSAGNSAFGAVNTSSTVDGPKALLRLTSSVASEDCATRSGTAGSAIRARLNNTSSATSFAPSWKLASCRLNRHLVAVPSCSHFDASRGTGFRSGPSSTSFS